MPRERRINCNEDLTQAKPVFPTTILSCSILLVIVAKIMHTFSHLCGFLKVPFTNKFPSGWPKDVLQMTPIPTFPKGWAPEHQAAVIPSPANSKEIGSLCPSPPKPPQPPSAVLSPYMMVFLLPKKSPFLGFLFYSIHYRETVDFRFSMSYIFGKPMHQGSF